MANPNKAKQIAELVAWAKRNGRPLPKSKADAEKLVNEFLAVIKRKSVLGVDASPPPRPSRPYAYLLSEEAFPEFVSNERQNTDFEQLVHDRTKALQQSDGDEIAAGLLVQSGERAEAKNVAAAVGSPPSAVGKRFSGTVTLSPAIIKQSSPALLWNADNDIETGPVTLTLSQQTPGIGSAALRAFALLTWGSYGTSHTAEVDIGRGCQLSVNASSIAVSLGLDALSAANTIQAVMSASMSFRTPSMNYSLIRSVYIDALANGSSSTVTPPLFAIGLLPIQMSLLTGSVQLDFYDTSNTLVYTQTVLNGTQVTSLPLTTDIWKIVVTNNTAPSQYIRLPFEIAL